MNNATVYKEHQENQESKKTENILISQEICTYLCEDKCHAVCVIKKTQV